jgi:methyltransferase (TIGR00027 family)
MVLARLRYPKWLLVAASIRPSEALPLEVRMSVTLPVESVADTAFLTAYCRALESERPDAHFRDPYARLLAGHRGEELLQGVPGGELTATGCIVRTCLLDSLLLRTIQEAAVDTVVNLGAGLDTRAHRLSLPPSLCWIEVDEAGVLAYKASRLDGCAPVCALESFSLDITDADARRTLLQRIGARAEVVLVLTEGLLVYMTPEQVSALAGDLQALPQCQWWLTDLVSANGLHFMQKAFTAAPSTRGVRLRFAPEDGPEFFRRYGWETAEFRSCLGEGRRLDRLFLAKAVMSAQLTNEQRDVLEKLFAVLKLKCVKQQSSS